MPGNFLIRFLYCYYREKRKILKNNKTADSYVNFIKVCAALAFSCGVVQFLIPSGGYRTSFVNLIFLTIAVATIFRFQQKTATERLHGKEKVFLKTVGACYLILSMFFSAWGNYINWNHWNSILVRVEEAQYQHRNDILLVEPYPIREDSLINVLSGFHISPMPFRGLTETDEINRTFARYYNIKGIKVSR